MDSLRFVICARADCQQVFFLCRVCDRGDRYCSRPCAYRARRATLQAAGRRYQRSWRGRVHHAARQAHYRAQHEEVTHQASHTPGPSGIVALPSATAVTPVGGKEDAVNAEPPSAMRRTRPRCARCGRPGRWVRHTTLAHLRPRPVPRR